MASDEAEQFSGRQRIEDVKDVGMWEIMHFGRVTESTAVTRSSSLVHRMALMSQASRCSAN